MAFTKHRAIMSDVFCEDRENEFAPHMGWLPDVGHGSHGNVTVDLAMCRGVSGMIPCIQGLALEFAFTT